MKYWSFLSLAVVVFFSSCISSKKYQAALSQVQTLTDQNTTCNKNLENVTGNLNTANTQLSEEQRRLNDARVENERLSHQVDVAGKNVADLARMGNMTQQQLQQEQQRLAQMQQLMKQQQAQVEALRKKMIDALVNFKSNELSVFTKNGKVYVSMQESLLFPSGSAVVNPKGKDALGTLAQVLNANPDISVLIEGHTDSIPIKGKYEDNWALSVARSTSIVRILTDSYNVDPLRVTASGRSKYEPVDTNSTPEGRAKNRRTEIILSPKLDELMKLLSGTPSAGG